MLQMKKDSSLNPSLKGKLDRRYEVLVIFLVEKRKIYSILLSFIRVMHLKLSFCVVKLLNVHHSMFFFFIAHGITI